MVRELLAPGDTETLLGLLERPDERLPDRDALLARTLGAAVADCRARLGEPAEWAWGRLHQGYFAHPLGAPHRCRTWGRCPRAARARA